MTNCKENLHHKHSMVKRKSFIESFIELLSDVRYKANIKKNAVIYVALVPGTIYLFICKINSDWAS